MTEPTITSSGQSISVNPTSPDASTKTVSEPLPSSSHSTPKSSSDKTTKLKGRKAFAVLGTFSSMLCVFIVSKYDVDAVGIWIDIIFALSLIIVTASVACAWIGSRHSSTARKYAGSQIDLLWLLVGSATVAIGFSSISQTEGRFITELKARDFLSTQENTTTLAISVTSDCLVSYNAPKAYCEAINILASQVGNTVSDAGMIRQRNIVCFNLPLAMTLQSELQDKINTLCQKSQEIETAFPEFKSEIKLPGSGPAWWEKIGKFGLCLAVGLRLAKSISDIVW